MIRSYPKIVFLYPTLVTALIAGIWTWILLKAKGGDLDQVSLAPGRVFMAVFVFNMTVLAFDFSRKGFVAAVLTVLLAVTFGILVETRLPVFLWFEKFLELFVLRAHPHFYFTIAATFLVLIGAVFVTGRFDFWEIRHNEVLHYQGFMADVDRFPAPGLRFKKSIPDVFEYALLRAGSITLMPAHGEKVEIQNVPNVNVVEHRLDGLLGTLQVEIAPSSAPAMAPPPLPPPTPPAGQ